ncbi:MAG: hypothetical protein COA69_00595 [Robiginitomaculum sp.]|nr:MAG: hypothetical protein COA69_00595 [Robiginitomaculum sp.]
MKPTEKIGMKKKILLGWLLLELAALPFAIPTMAKIAQTSPGPITRAVFVDVPAPAGHTLMLVAADGPFVIIAKGAATKFRTHIEITGKINGKVNGTAFGASAQNLGPNDLCAHSNSVQPSIIYRSERKTAENTGPIISQAISVEISYDPALHPEFQVKTNANPSTHSLPTAPNCGSDEQA